MNESEVHSDARGHYSVHTLGCKANLSEGDRLEGEFRKKGWAPWKSQDASPSGKFICVINSCTVTDEADRQSRKLASKLGRIHPGALIVVTGCAAEVDPERIAASTGVHYVIGNREKLTLVDQVLELVEKPRLPGAPGEVLGSARGYEQILSRHPRDREWPSVESPELLTDSQHTRVFLKIQEGCNAFCTYCVIPYGRGPSRSLSLEQVVQKIQELVQSGTQEVVLTGTNIGDWGQDFGSSFEDLVEGILKQTDLKRLRLSSLDPVEISDRLIQLMKEHPQLCKHFHVSLQSAHPRILKLMKRKYGIEEVRSCLKRIAEISSSEVDRPFVGMDVITGFPGESEENFQQSLEELKSLPWDRLHVFPYSEREGTPATRLPQAVPVHQRKERARVLQALSFERLQARYAAIQEELRQGKAPLKSVLMERPYHSQSGVSVSGTTSNYVRIRVVGEALSEQVQRNSIQEICPDVIRSSAAQGEVWFENGSLIDQAMA